MLLQKDDGEREIRLMQWGLIPSWHKGAAKEFSLNMFNARLDGIADKVG